MDGLIDVQQDRRQALEQVQALALALQVEPGAAAHTLGAECGPLPQDLPHAHDPGLTGDQDVKVAAEAVLQRRDLIEFGHQLVRIYAPFQVQRQLQAVEVGLVPHITDLPDLARLDQFCDLIHDGFHRGGGGDLGHLDDIFPGTVR